MLSHHISLKIVSLYQFLQNFCTSAHLQMFTLQGFSGRDMGVKTRKQSNWSKQFAIQRKTNWKHYQEMPITDAMAAKHLLR